MIGLTRSVRVFAHRGPVDMRKSFDTLAALVDAGAGQSVMEGDVFVFVGRTKRRAKVLWWDGTGVLVLSKRLCKGSFVAPWEMKGVAALLWTTSELALFLEGSEFVGRMPLSPPPYKASDDTLRFV